MGIEGQIRKLWQQMKLRRKVKYTGTQRKEKNPKKTTADKSNNITRKNTSKDIDERRKTQRVKQYKQNRALKNKER